MAVGVKSLWATDSTRGIPVGVQDDLGIDELSGRDPLVQGLAEGRSGSHVCRRCNKLCSSGGPFIRSGETVRAQRRAKEREYDVQASGSRHLESVAVAVGSGVHGKSRVGA